MKSKEEILEAQNNLISKVYDLILNPKTSDDERTILVEFKNANNTTWNFEKNLMDLSRALRQLSIKKLNNKETLSEAVGKFYMDISKVGLHEKNLGMGLIYLSFLGSN